MFMIDRTFWAQKITLKNRWNLHVLLSVYCWKVIKYCKLHQVLSIFQEQFLSSKCGNTLISYTSTFCHILQLSTNFCTTFTKCCQLFSSFVNFYYFLPILTNFYCLPPNFQSLPLLTNFYTTFTNFYHFLPPFTNFYYLSPIFKNFYTTLTTSHQFCDTKLLFKIVADKIYHHL